MTPLIRIALILLVATSGAGAQATKPARPASEVDDDSVSGQKLLGPQFESGAAGIALRPPVGCKEIRRAGVADEVVQYISEEREWALKVSRVMLSKPVPLTSSKTAGAGIVENLVSQLKGKYPAAQIVRQDVTNIRDGDVGIIVARYTLGTGHKLSQQAIVQANDQLYYVLDFTTPGARPQANGAQANGEDPNEKLAVATFNAVLESVRLLDRGSVKEDQDQRLYRTRSLYVNLTPTRLKKALIPEQWMRLIREGKDIGYTYAVEETQDRAGSEGVLVGIRSRTVPEQGQQVDAESWLFCSMDRNHEVWSSVAKINTAKGETHVSEFGASDRQFGRVVDPNLEPGEKRDPKQPPVRPAETYSLTVTHVGRSNTGEPLQRDLPPFYLPQAIGHLLPRLVPLREPKTFLFATYVSDQRQVMLRYVDVGDEADYNLGGKRVHAVPIRDRIGLEGSVTTHYVSPEGKYLGSENKDSKILILPTDEKTLRRLWVNADLSRPGKIEQPPPIPAPKKSGP